MMISSQPILTSDGQGPIAGTIIMADYLDDQALKDLSDTMLDPVFVRSAGAIDLPSDFLTAASLLSSQKQTAAVHLSGQQTGGYAFIPDVFGRPGIILKIVLPRDIRAQSLNTMRYFIILLWGLVIGFGFILHFLMDKVVISKVTRLSDYVSDVRETGDLSKRSIDDGKDELAKLNSGVNNLVVSLQDSQKSLVEQKEEEEALRRTIESVADGIITTDLENNIFQVNDATVRIQGYDKKEELIGKNFFSMVPDEDRRVAEVYMKKALQEGYVIHTECRLCKRDGTPIPIELTAAVLKDPKGEPAGMVAITRDISARKQAEDKLRHSEEKYSTIVEKSNDGIVIIQNNLVKLANSKMQQFTGFPVTEIVGRPFIEFVHPSFRTYVTERRIKKIIREEVPQKYRISLAGKDLEELQVELNETQIMFEGKQADLAIIRDVSDASRAEADRRMMLDSFAAGAILIDPETHTVVDANQAAVNMFGMNKHDLVGHACQRFICPAEEGKCPVTELGETVNVSERNLLNVNGREIPVLKSVNKVSWQGHNYLFETFIDITARKKTETELRLQKDLIERILSASPNAEVVIGEDGKIIMANRTFCGWFGSKTRLELISDVIPVQELADAVLESRLNEHLKNEVEFRLSVGGGERRIFVCRILPMLKTEMLLIISDITEERDRLERLQLSERLVSVGEMASGVAHELNNPLTSVIALSQLLLKTDLSPDTREDLEAIYGEARRAAEVVKNLLTFARKHTPEKKLTQINGIIQDVIKLRAYEHKVNNIQVKTIFDPELPNIMVDSFQMQQVFLNLILNAEFAIIQTHKPGTITLSTETLSGNVKIVCKDDGPGISPENMKHLFNPFFTTKEVGKGTGLGLSICFGLISGHAGRIYAESKPGEGAAFIIELPVPPVPMQAATANAK